MAAARVLAELTWPEIAELVEGGEDLCLLPVGATEQHGRHMAVGTDTIIADAVCREASARTGVPLLPTVAISASQAHTRKWPGTLALPPRLFVETVVEISRWVRASGFERLLFVNAHVGNAAPLKVATDEIRHVGELRVGLLHWYELTPEIVARATDDAIDWHAHRAETALMLHLRPDLVRMNEIRDDPDRTPGLVLSYTVAETSRDGVTGSPTLATAEEGARLFEHIVEALAGLVEAARREEPPSL